MRVQDGAAASVAAVAVAAAAAASSAVSGEGGSVAAQLTNGSAVAAVLQLQQQQQQQQSQIMLQDPHMLMQIAYQQQELQAQLQTLQLGPAPPTAVSTPQPKHAPPTTAYPQAQAAPYYVTGGEAVTVPVSVPVPVPQAPYVNPANATYLAPPPAAVAYAQAQTAATQQPQPAPQASQAAAQPSQGPSSMNFHQNYNTVGGTTYFVPPAQTTTRPTVLPQRRPTNAIPILPPSEKHKSRIVSNANANPKTDEASGSSDNIDHIIDNMFVQRPAYQPPPTSTGAGDNAATKSASEDLNSNTSVGQPISGEQTRQAIAVPGQEWVHVYANERQQEGRLQLQQPQQYRQSYTMLPSHVGYYHAN